MVHKQEFVPFRIQHSHVPVQYTTHEHNHHCPVTAQTNSQSATSQSIVQRNIGWIPLIQIHNDMFLHWIMMSIYGYWSMNYKH